MDKTTEFDYLLNRLEHAGQQETPADHYYGTHRASLLRHVRALEADARRWKTFCARLSARPNPMRGQWKLVEVSPMYGDEKEVRDLQQAVDEYADAQVPRVGAA